MRELWSLIGVLLLTAGSVLAQNEEDALKFSLSEPFGSARYTGMAGAFGALGGDLSAATWNPASVGIYRRNDLSLSTAISGANAVGIYEGTETRTDDFQFHLPQFGLASTNSTDNAEWKWVNFAIGYNKLQNFNENYVVTGDAVNTSLLNVFLNQANGTNFDELNDVFPFGAGLAWNTFLLDTLNSDVPDEFFSAVPGGPVTQRMDVKTDGRMGETFLAIGTNRLDKLYIGATLGFPIINMDRRIIYTEKELDPTLELSEWSYLDNLSISGNGINVKLGVIYRATEWLRLGGAYHSPTALSFSDVWDTEINSTFKDGQTFDSFITGSYDYRLRTPGRYIASAAFILGKYGLISADYHYIDYSSAKFRPSNLILDGYDFSSENTAISNLYRGTHNVRIGAESRISQILRLRGGFAFSQHPFVNGASQNAINILTYSGGIGLRYSNFYAEFAYQYTSTSNDFYLYDQAYVDLARIDRTKGEAILTIGIRY